MESFSSTLVAEDTRNLENLLEGWGEVLDPKYQFSNPFVLDGKAVDAIISTEIPVSLTFTPTSFGSPFSDTTTPDSSPFFDHSPSSPGSDLMMNFTTSSSDYSSSSDELDQELLSMETNQVQPESISDLSSYLSMESRDRISFTFVPQSMEESAFKNSCLPPLPAVSSMSQANSIKPEPVKSDKKACKKRRRNTSEGSSKPVKIDLSEEELLKFDGKGIENYIKSITNSRSLSPSEEKELKRIRRLIKNREYAQSSRDKRKQYMEDMEGQLNVVNQEKAALQQKVNTLEIENKTLKFHLARLMKDSDISSLTGPSAPASKKANINKTATISLFMVLLSFGLFTISLSGATPFTAKTHSISASTFAPIQKGTTRFILSIEEDHLQESSIASKMVPSFLQEFLEKYNIVDTQGHNSNNFQQPHESVNCHGDTCSTK